MEGCSGARWSMNKQEPFSESLAFRTQATIVGQPLPNPTFICFQVGTQTLCCQGMVIAWCFACFFPNMKCPHFKELAMNSN